jgi:hypothetical protein
MYMESHGGCVVRDGSVPRSKLFAARDVGVFSTKSALTGL